MLILTLATGSLMNGAVLAHAASPTPKPSATPKPTAGATPAPDRATFGIGPATGGKRDRRPNISYSTAGGGVYSDTVAVQNFAEKPIDLQIYTTNLVNSADGQLGLAKQNVNYGTALWIRLPQQSQTVHVPASDPAKGPGTVIMPIRMDVPVGATPGDHGASIVASLETLGKNPLGQNVKLEQRIGTRVFVRVRGTARTELTVQNISVKYKPNSNPFAAGSAHVRYLLRNSGNINLGAHQTVSISGMFGTNASAAPIKDFELLLPGSGVWVDVDVAKVFPTIWETVHITVVPLPPKGDPDPKAMAVTKDVDFTAVPWLLILVIVAVLLLLIGLIWFLIRRRRAKRRGGDSGGNGGGKKEPKPTPPTPTDAQAKPDTQPDSVTEPARVIEPASATGSEMRARRPRTRFVPAAVVLAAVVALWAGGTSVALADSVPYTDPGSIGGIGLCSKDGQPVTSGNINEHPFVWRAVSSVKAPGGTLDQGSATLLAYQPRPNVSPDQWNGDTLTAASAYKKTTYPMSAGTDQDFSLNDYLKEFPLMLNGLVQLRMYTAVPGRGINNSEYPTTDLKVTGDKWTVVRGPKTSCTTGEVTSSENISPNPPAATAKATTHPSGSNATKAATTSSGAAGLSGSATTGPSQSSSSTSTALKKVAKESGSGAGVAIGVVVLVLLAAAGGGGWLWFRKRDAAHIAGAAASELPTEIADGSETE